MRSFQFALFALLTFLLAGPFAPPAFSILPESGMYWTPHSPGRGYYIDVQEGMVFMVIYAFDEETGEPEIYVANGELRDDGFDMGIAFHFAPPLNPEGYLPLHFFSADLYRVTDGPCLTCPHHGDTAEYEHVGTTIVWFPYKTGPYVALYLFDGDVTNDQFVERLNWGRERMISTSGSLTSLRFHDLRGQWVFVDQSDPDSTPWRFDFDELDPDTNEVNVPYDAVFRDTYRGAELRCVMRTPVEMETLNGCELHWNGEVLFSANIRDLGVNRIQAFRGELPPIITDPPLPQPEYHRGPDTVIGLRVEMPPPQEEDDDQPES